MGIALKRWTFQDGSYRQLWQPDIGLKHIAAKLRPSNGSIRWNSKVQVTNEFVQFQLRKNYCHSTTGVADAFTWMMSRYDVDEIETFRITRCSTHSMPAHLFSHHIIQASNGKLKKMLKINSPHVFIVTKRILYGYRAQSTHTMSAVLNRVKEKKKEKTRRKIQLQKLHPNELIFIIYSSSIRHTASSTTRLCRLCITFVCFGVNFFSLSDSPDTSYRGRILERTVRHMFHMSIFHISVSVVI